MVYYGPHMKVDYDHLVFDEIDEIIVMQQHCGGENIIVHKENLKPGGDFYYYIILCGSAFTRSFLYFYL